MRIELNGTGETGLAARARKLIADGADRDELAEWVRADIPIFTRTETLGWWVDWDEKLHKRSRRRSVSGDIS